MYESGVKVGIMGDEDEVPAAAAAQPETCPDPTGEVIDQTINEVPERNSTLPDYKPNPTPPNDQNARNVPNSAPCSGE